MGHWRNRGRQQEMFPGCSKPGTIIVSDCWKAYSKLETHGYEHRKVNHSVEFVNKASDLTNEIEGHWRHAKCKLPKFAFESIFSQHIWQNLFGGTCTAMKTGLEYF